MSTTDSTEFFLFPHMILPEAAYRNFYFFLPRLSVLEILTPAPIPEWGGGRFSGSPVFRDEKELLSRVSSCIQGYRDFAEVHGAGAGTLAFLSQALQETVETRYGIQEELRGKCAAQPDAAQKELFQSAVFLEIARELDEKELELDAGYAQLNALEKDFRGILGISDEDEVLEAAEAGISMPLMPDRAGMSFMLPYRIKSWFRLFATLQLQSFPVFTAFQCDIVDELSELVRSGSHRSGRQFSSVRFPLGSIPRMDGLGLRQFRSLIEAPGTTESLESYRQGLQELITAAAAGEARDGLETRSEPLRQHLERLCKLCEASSGDQVNLSLVLLEGLTLPELFASLGITGFQPPKGSATNWSVPFLCID